jgi:signal transduction histidine kinase
MIQAPIPDQEEERLQEVLRYHLLDTPPEQEYNDIAKLASQICQTPMSTVSLIDHYRQWHKAEVGLGASEAERASSFCGHTIAQNGVLEVQDATLDERFHDNPFVTDDPNVRFYAGIPLVSPRGYNIGSLCVIDTKPRQLNAEQKFALEVLANQVIKMFELRVKNKETENKNAIIENQNQHLEEMNAIQNKIISIVSHDIRGPVSSLKNVITLRKDDDISNDEVMEFMDTVNGQLDNTLYMLTNLVEWGALLRRKNHVELNPVDLYGLVISEMNVQVLSFSMKHNTLDNKVRENCMVHSDENMLRFMLRNLVGNANKFTENGRITVAAEREADQYRISVTDTGIGMSEEIRANLFKPSRRSSRKGTQMEDGSGLGLILTMEIAHTLGTELNVDSAPGKGTSINFLIPAYQ